MTSRDRYGSDILSTDWRAPKRGRAVEAPAELGAVVEEVTTDMAGEIVAVDRDLGTLTLEDRRGKRRTFPLGPGFLLEGRPVILTAPLRAAAPGRPARTASGSFAVADAPGARVARPSRILVEGRQDAELVEKVWGDDLRVEGVVVEFLGRVVDLARGGARRGAPPSAERRYGVLVDHLVPGSKESRIADNIPRAPIGTDVLIVGHPFIDVWQASNRPGRHRAWPEVPRDTEFKTGACQPLGWPQRVQLYRPGLAAHPRQGAVVQRPRPAFLGRVEELIDYVTS